MQSYLGEIAAIIASVLFSFSSTLFTVVGRKVGSAVLNRTRLVMATLWLLLAHGLLGIPLPLQAGAERWMWFGISGAIGLALGDAFLFEAFVRIGPRLSMLLMALAPAIATILAWIFLGEVLTLGQVLGIGITLAGIAWVVSERNGQKEQSQVDRKKYVSGLLIGLAAATGQAVGLVTARPGLEGEFPALSGTLMRMVSGMVVLWVVTILTKQVGKTILMLKAGPKVLFWIGAASLLGPTLGVTFSLVAIQNTEVGVASTLTALTPIFLLPVGAIFFKEKLGWQAVGGTLVAMAGVGMLFLV